MITRSAPRVLIAALIAALFTILIGYVPHAAGSGAAAAGPNASAGLVRRAPDGPHGAGGYSSTLAQVSQPMTAEEFLVLLRDAGFDDIPILEIAVSRDWIPGAFSPHYLVGGATLEIFELASPAQVEAALESFPGNDESLSPQDELIWGAGSLVIILFDAGDHADVEGIISDLVGSPAIRVAARLTPGDVLRQLTLAGFGVPPVAINVAREWILVSGIGSIVDTTTIEIYELESAAAVEVALLDLDAVAGGPPANATIWASGRLVVILLSAPQHPLIEASLSDLLGGPRIATITGSPLPPPPTGGPGEGPPLVATSVDALADALRSAGLDVVVTDSVATQPWIPESGRHLVVDGAGVDVFVLASEEAVDGATATRKNGPVSVQPPGNVEVWLNGTTFIILRDAPQHPVVSAAISALIGHPQFSTIAVSLPPPPPGALPSTGNGGFADETNGSPRMWLFVAGSLVLFAALGYGVEARLRRRFSSHASATKRAPSGVTAGRPARK